MVYSSPDMLGLIAELYTRRASMVLGKQAQKLGMTLEQYLDTCPYVVQEGLKLLGTIHRRYMSGDYRHSENELLRIEAFANHLIALHQAHVNQPVRALNFDIKKLEQKDRCAAKTYQRAIGKVRTEW